MFVSAEGFEVNITPQASNNNNKCQRHQSLSVRSALSGVGFPIGLPFSSSKNSHFQNEAKCKTFLVKISLFAWE